MPDFDTLGPSVGIPKFYEQLLLFMTTTKNYTHVISRRRQNDTHENSRKPIKHQSCLAHVAGSKFGGTSSESL